MTTPTGRTVIRGATVLTQDERLGTVVGDVLVEDGKISAVGAGLEADGATELPAHGKVVLPGFIDTHRHTWQGAIRQTGIGWDFPTYRRYIQNTWGPAFTPQDVYIGNLVGAYGALDAGITTLRDESHIQNSPEHTDQAVAAL